MKGPSELSHHVRESPGSEAARNVAVTSWARQPLNGRPGSGQITASFEDEGGRFDGGAGWSSRREHISPQAPRTRPVFCSTCSAIPLPRYMQFPARATRDAQETQHHEPGRQSPLRPPSLRSADPARKLVEGIQLRHILVAQGKRIPWCDHCNRAMLQFLATEQLCPRNCGRDITALARTMDCTYPGFEEAVWPKIKAALRRKLQDLHRDGNIVIYTDHDGVEQAHWPVQTSRWRRSDWDGRRDHIVPEHIRERLETTGTLEDTGGGGQQQGGAYFVFERGRGGRGDRRPDTPEDLPRSDTRLREESRRRPSVLSGDVVYQPAGLSDDGAHWPDGLSEDGLPPRQDTYRPPYVETASETSTSSRRSRASSSWSRRYAPWDTSAWVSIPDQPNHRRQTLTSLQVNRSSRRRNDRRR